MVEIPASASVKPLEKQRSPAWGDEPSIEAAENGIAIKFGDKDLGKLAWDIVYEKLPKKKRTTAPSTAATSRASDAADREAAGNKRDFDKLFKPLPLAFKKTSEGGLLFETWSADATKDGI